MRGKVLDTHNFKKVLENFVKLIIKTSKLELFFAVSERAKGRFLSLASALKTSERVESEQRPMTPSACYLLDHLFEKHI